MKLILIILLSELNEDSTHAHKRKLNTNARILNEILAIRIHPYIKGIMDYD